MKEFHTVRKHVQNINKSNPRTCYPIAIVTDSSARVARRTEDPNIPRPRLFHHVNVLWNSPFHFGTTITLCEAIIHMSNVEGLPAQQVFNEV